MKQGQEPGQRFVLKLRKPSASLWFFPGKTGTNTLHKEEACENEFIEPIVVNAFV
jgi:hypothetical protein